jgi:hypothetical protein
MGQLLSDFECSCLGSAQKHNDCTGSEVCIACGRVLCCKTKTKTQMSNDIFLCPLCQISESGLRKYDAILVSTPMF